MDTTARALVLTVSILLSCSCNHGLPDPYGPVPGAAQLAWQNMEYNMFVHFGPNTFSGLEWGSGAEPEDLFNPTGLDCRQWASTAAAAGMKGIIVTAKHHDGFCLWPNPESSHSVASSSWRDGQGDVLKDLSEACREYGLGFGVYISPWDRNDPDYGSEKYNDKYLRTLSSVLDGKYGPVFELWFDGACGEGPGGRRQVYDWERFHDCVRKLQAGTIMFSDTGPGCRWVGNENGFAAATNWSRLNVSGFTPGAGAPPADTLQSGNVHGEKWIPAEADVSIRKGWFWRPGETPKSVEELMDIWYGSVGRNALLLLNVPADTCGRIAHEDSLRLMEFRQRREAEFGVNLAADAKLTANACRSRKHSPRRLADGDPDTFWAVPDGDLTPSFTIILPQERCFDRIVLQEYIALGQRVSGFKVEARSKGGEWKRIAEGSTIGYKRILCTPEVTASEVRVSVTSSFACPVLSEAGLYKSPVRQ